MSSTVGKVIHCRAAVLWKEGEPLKIENITVDPPKGREIRVRNVSAGICASDAHFLWNQETDLKLDFGGLPVVLGHEGSAVVESVGPDVKDVAVGDSIIPLFIPNCESCDLCLNPRTNRCLDAGFTTTLYHDFERRETRMRVNGKPLLAFCGTNTYSEYSVLRASQICKVNPKLNLKNACIIGCAVGTGFGTVMELAKVYPGATCAVWGLGAIGLSTCLACKQAGARRVIGVDINPDKRDFAKKFGCTEFVDPKSLSIGCYEREYSKNIKEFSFSDIPLAEYFKSSGGLDYAFDCIGNIEVLRTGLQSLTPWGTLAAVGLGPSGKTLEVKVSDLLNGQQLMGGYFANQKSRKAVLELTERYVRGELPIDALITHRFKLDEINEAFDLLRKGKSVRSVIDF